MKWIVVVFVLIASPALAEPTPFRWSQHRAVAGRLSDAAVATAIAADAVASWRSEHRGHAYGCQAARLGITLGASELTKRIVHRERPDHSDNKSFYSMHTALAAQSMGWRTEVRIPVTALVAFGRMGADKHYMTDTLVGAVAGGLASLVCRHGT